MLPGNCEFEMQAVAAKNATQPLPCADGDPKRARVGPEKWRARRDRTPDPGLLQISRNKDGATIDPVSLFLMDAQCEHGWLRNDASPSGLSDTSSIANNAALLRDYASC